MVRVARREQLVATTTSLVSEPLTFINSSVRIYENTKAFTLPILIQQTLIDTIFVLFDTKIIGLSDFFIIKLITDHFIVFEGVTIILELSISLARGSKTSLHHLLMYVLGHFRVPPATTNLFLSCSLILISLVRTRTFIRMTLVMRGLLI